MQCEHNSLIMDLKMQHRHENKFFQIVAAIVQAMTENISNVFILIYTEFLPTTGFKYSTDVTFRKLQPYFGDMKNVKT